MSKCNKSLIEDLQHIDFDKDGCVHLALHRKATQKKLWESLQQFKEIETPVAKQKELDKEAF